MQADKPRPTPPLQQPSTVDRQKTTDSSAPATDRPAYSADYISPPSNSSLVQGGYSPSLNAEINERAGLLVSYNHLTYLLYLLSYFTAGLLWIVPIVMNYLKRQEAEGTWLATHFDWQIKTFWYSIIFFVIGAMITLFSLGGIGIGVFADSSHLTIGSFALFSLGLFIVALTVIWHLYRIIRGWIALADKRPVP